mgnify:FL=1
MEFITAYENFYKELGESKKMVLSTSLNDVVTSRMMSIVVLNKKIYFQTDRTFRKYNQIKENPKVSLCIDNIQIEGECEKVGMPSDNAEFVEAYKKHFPSSYTRYSCLKNERLFVVTPTFVEKWLYIDGIPYIEIFDIVHRQYELRQYVGV